MTKLPDLIKTSAEGLLKDTRSGGLVVSDLSGYEKMRAAREARRRQADLERRLERLERIVAGLTGSEERDFGE